MDAGHPPPQFAAGQIPRRLFAFSAGFLTQHRLRRILHLAGHRVCIGPPRATDGVVVWGKSQTARRGQAVARHLKLPLIRVEDAFLRSVRPGRMGDAPLGLLIDPVGLHYDATGPNLIDHLIHTTDLQNSNLLARANAAIARIRHLDLSKYNMHDPGLAVPDAGYVLVVDQTIGDASLRASGADQSTFDAMLARAKADFPGARIVLKSHPETSLGLRPGHFGAKDAQGQVSLITAPVSPHRLLQGAQAVYTVSSHLGFEAIVAGHIPHVFGTPFYAGWGLSKDEICHPRRVERLTAPQLFAAAMILAPTWYDPCRDRLCALEDVLDQLEAETRAYRDDQGGHVASGMRAWKRGHLQAFYGRHRPLRFVNAPDSAAMLAEKTGRGLLIWAGKDQPGLLTTAPVRRVEDGFLRSRGLGANLIPPVSLIADDLGIYYDPARPSRLEALIAGPLPPGGALRAARLITALVNGGASKYNCGTTKLPGLPDGPAILVAGQVEDDASILMGAGHIRTNLALLAAARAAHPTAVLVYKPHPDVEAGLRPGRLSPAQMAGLADVVLQGADPAACIARCDEVWTITSTLGFEALLRGKPVTSVGMPFYAGWGLTTDLCPVPERRLQLAQQARTHGPLDLNRLVHAALIACPRYHDAVSGLPCSPETALHRLINGPVPHLRLAHRGLAKLQGRLAGLAHLWR